MTYLIIYSTYVHADDTSRRETRNYTFKDMSGPIEAIAAACEGLAIKEQQITAVIRQ